MKKRWVILLAWVLALAALFLPAAKVYVHSQLGAETAALFPATVSVGDLALRGADCLPTDAVPELALLHLDGWLLLAGLALLIAGGAAAFVKKRGGIHAALALTTLAAACLGAFAMQVNNLCSSLLFQLLLDVQAWLYFPLAAAVLQLIVLAVLMKGGEPLALSDVACRRLGGALALLAALCLLLPGHVTSVPETVTENPADAAAMSRSLSLLDEALAREPSLYALGQAQGAFTNVISGDLAVLSPYAADQNVAGIFAIRTSTATPNVSLLAAALLLLVAAALAFLPKVDRWFPLALSALATLLVGSAALGVMGVSDADMYGTASRQLAKLGLGRATIAPLLTAVLALGASCFGVLSVRYANDPYFVNPIPANQRLRTVSLALAVVSLVMMLLPGMSVSFTKPGRNKAQSVVEMTGIQAMLFQTPEDILHPKDSKGKLIYEEDAAEDELTASGAESTMRTLSNTFGGMTWLAVLLTAAGLACVAARKNKRAPITLFLLAFGVRALSWVLMMVQMPKAMGSVAGTLYLYVSLPTLVFAAFFANFAHMEELPKKYRLFLMMLPFLLAVFLFSYLPLYGWSYAFYNYKFGLPMSEQEFVGLKWFTEMVTNVGHRENIVRVLKNTFGMSGLNLLTSWMPMIFAVFLNEITRTRFKKFVQIFTTLPNFISWALVFSFAMCMFSMETGIYTKFMMSIGAINEPVAWLNSSDHIWLKMWGWSTWKGLGWGAIMYLAAIAGIDQELYEAAKVDGAGRWMQMRYITLPGLLPTFFVLLMLSISNILNNGMEQYLVFQNPMNKNTIEVLDLYVYNITIASKGTTLYSFATAIGILKTLVSVTLLFTANFASKKLRGESIM